MKRIIFSFAALLALKAAGQSPDLIVDQGRLVSSVELQTASFSSNDCATVEGCASEGVRRLVKFDAGIINTGEGDLLLGDPQANPDLFVFSPCHGHYHLKGVADYELISSNGTVLVTARKQAFCLRDDIAAMAGAGPAKYNCDFQGISPGWEDVYDKSLDCQWLDITGVPDGDYILRILLNPERVFIESNYDNNDASVMISLRTSTPPPTNGNCKCTCKCKKENPKKPWDWKNLADKFKKNGKKQNDNCVCKPKNGKAKGHCGCNAKSGSGSKGKSCCTAKCSCKQKAKGCGCKGQGHKGDGDDDDQGKGDNDDDGGKDDDHDDD